MVTRWIAQFVVDLVWMVALAYAVVDLVLGALWVRRAWGEHLATSERHHQRVSARAQRRLPSSSGAMDFPESPALPLLPVGAARREPAAPTGPECRVVETPALPPGVSPTRPWVGPAGVLAHPVATGLGHTACGRPVVTPTLVGGLRR